LEVGTGFHPELTGRENVYLNGAILGMRRFEIDAKFDEIQAFAGVEKFIDTPVKFYSSGMRVRLAFAVAAHLEPEILLVDEVLSVGDAEFRKKSVKKMEDVSQTGRTVLFVSHNMETILNLCSRVIWLHEGQVQADGPAEDVVRAYIASASERASTIPLETRTDRVGDGRLLFTGFEIRDEAGKLIDSVMTGQTVDFVFFYKTFVPDLRNISVWFAIKDAFGKRLAGFWSRQTNENFDVIPPEGAFVCRLPRVSLAPGVYHIRAVAYLENETKADDIDSMVTFEVVRGDFYGTGVLRKHGVFLMDYAWRLDEKAPVNV
jgi:lipopolysaccharide transport system ATP-binding protein